MGDARTATGDWFRARGLPQFVAESNASTDLWTRALPALTLLFLGELIFLAPNRSFPIWLSALVVAGMFAFAVGGWALINRRRGRRPLARPDDVGPFEVAAFVTIPVLVPLVFGFQVRQAVLTGLANIVILGAIYVSTSYGVVSMTRWALTRVKRQLQAIVSLLARALPMLALLVTFLFLTQEVWQTAGALTGLPYWIVVGLFPLVGVLFLVARLPTDVGELNRFEDRDEVVALVAGTPVAGVPVDPEVASPPLSRREWGNVGLVALFSQGVQIALVSLLIGCFFVMLGLLLVDEDTTRQWAEQLNVLATLSIGNRQLVLTEELLRVAGFLTAFSGLNFTVYVLTDVAYRAEFREEVVGELRQAFAVRALSRRTTMSPT